MQRGVYIKLGILAFLILSGFIGYQFFSSQLKNKEAVLGKKTQLSEVDPTPTDEPLFKETLKRAVESGQKSVNETAQNVATTVSNAVNTTTSRTVETVKEYIYDKTVGNALQQINNLPAAEKEKIKEYICK
ncbi:hypothetical protein HZC27_01065 [Candidatus Roizmanbacteria bacterium]|nr:hypothetical protein [Candidatus Roizmanbacteria bacterium]